MENQINPIAHKNAIVARFINSSFNIQHMYSFEQLVFILDERSSDKKCDRIVVKQLFNQSKDINNKSNIERIIQKYIENLQTTKLCARRQQIKYSKIIQQIQIVKSNKSQCVPYVFLTLYQATIHSHFSKIPIFSYKISPSNIPQTTIVNQLNPVLNHSYTLQLPDNSFQILFYQSSVQIGRWIFNGQNKQSDKQQKITIKHEGLQVKIKVKYFDHNKSLARQIEEKLKKKKQVEQQLMASRNAYNRLLNFQPFFLSDYLDHLIHQSLSTQQNSIDEQNKLYQFSQLLVSKIPFLKKCVRNYYYILFLEVIVSTFGCLYSPISIINLLVWLYIISLISKKSNYQIGIKFWVVFFVQIIIIFNTIFGMNIQIKPEINRYFIWILVLDCILQVFSIFFLWICIIRRNQFDSQIQQLQMKFNQPNTNRV